MLYQSTLISGLGVLAIVCTASSAMAGYDNGGYDPLYWNGPEGTDYNVLFNKTDKYRSYSGVKRCRSFKIKYQKTGRSYWLRKYKNCLAD